MGNRWIQAAALAVVAFFFVGCTTVVSPPQKVPIGKVLDFDSVAVDGARVVATGSSSSSLGIPSATILEPDTAGIYRVTAVLTPSSPGSAELTGSVAAFGGVVAVGTEDPVGGNRSIVVFRPDGAGGYGEVRIDAPPEATFRFGAQLAISDQKLVASGLVTPQGSGSASLFGLFVYDLDDLGAEPYRLARGTSGFPRFDLDGDTVVATTNDGVVAISPDGAGGYVETPLAGSGLHAAIAGGRVAVSVGSDVQLFGKVPSGAWELQATVDASASQRIIAVDLSPRVLVVDGEAQTQVYDLDASEPQLVAALTSDEPEVGNRRYGGSLAVSDAALVIREEQQGSYLNNDVIVRPLKVAPMPGAAIRGRLVLGDAFNLENATPVEGVAVELRADDGSGSVVASATSQSDGRYALEGLQPGCYQVRFVAPVGFSFNGRQAIDRPQCLSAVEQRYRFDGELATDSQRSSVGGQVLELDGTPVAGVEVDVVAGWFQTSTWRPETYGYVGTAVTDASGRWTFPVTEGTYDVVFVAPQGRDFTQPRRDPGFLRRDNIFVGPQNPPSDINATLAPS